MELQTLLMKVAEARCPELRRRRNRAVSGGRRRPSESFSKEGNFREGRDEGKKNVRFRCDCGRVFGNGFLRFAKKYSAQPRLGCFLALTLRV